MNKAEPQRVSAPKRKGANAQAPGVYTPVLRLQTPVVDPGETVMGELFFSGFGTAGAAKIVFYPPTEIFEKNGCWVSVRTLETPRPGAQADIVHLESFAEDFGVCVQFPVWDLTDGSKLDYFFTVPGSNEPLRLHSESVMESEGGIRRAPMSFKLKLRKTARPGTYPITFVFTYFNGAAWQSSSLQTAFTVRNILQRNEISFGVAAVSAAVATVVGAALSLLDTWDKVVPLTLAAFHFLFPPI